LFWRSK